MTFGPVQILVCGFDRTDQFRGEVVEELANLRGRGLIRLIDLFLAVKDPNGELKAKEMNDLTEEESVEFGQVVGKLLGSPGMSPENATTDAVESVLSAASKSVGLDYPGLRDLVESLEPGKAFGVLMFEHTWAIPLRDAIRRAGGFPLAQGFLTQEALLMIGEELTMITEAEQAIEVAQIVKSAAILDTLTTLQEAEAIKTAIAADVVRTLVVANLIEETAVAEVIDTLAAAGLLEAEYLDAATKTEAEKTVEDQAFFKSTD